MVKQKDDRSETKFVVAVQETLVGRRSDIEQANRLTEGCPPQPGLGWDAGFESIFGFAVPWDGCSWTHNKVI